jgi:hypothetical protein
VIRVERIKMGVGRPVCQRGAFVPTAVIPGHAVATLLRLASRLS